MSDNHGRLLVFGGTGFLGGHICANSRDRFEVHATWFSTSPPTNSNAIWHRCDVSNEADVRSLIERVQPTHVVNVAYRQAGDNAYDVCAKGPAFIAHAAVEIGARIVHFSTDLVFDGELGRPYVETDQVSPIGPYGEAKVESEERVLAIDPSALVIRTSLIYGATDAPQEQLVARAIRDGDIAFFTDEWRSPAHVSDLSRTTLELTLADVGGLIHVAGVERINRFEFARLLATHLGFDAATLRGRTQDPALGRRAKDVSLDCRRLHDLGVTLPGPSAKITERTAQS